jgi:hypothetical protein
MIPQLLQIRARTLSWACGLRCRLNTLMAVGLLLCAGSASAVPLTWTFYNMRTVSGITVSGSFMFDAAVGGVAGFSNVNITSSVPGVYTAVGDGIASGLFAYTPKAGVDQTGQPAVFFFFPAALTGAGGTLNFVLNVTPIAGTGTCNNAACTNIAYIGNNATLVSGSVSTIAPTPVTVTVPTLNQWGLLILGLLMASLAAWQVRRAGRR